MSSTSHQPTQIVILGGGGDLAQRKLLPALFDLYIKAKLPDIFSIIGLARTVRSNNEYCRLVKEAIRMQRSSCDESLLDDFCMHVQYVSGSLDTEQSYTDLFTTITDFETAKKVQTHRLFYLAVPPAQYEPIFEHLHATGLLSSDTDALHWSRILIEKPFGSDYTSAYELDKKLSSLFAEKQIFRIDHYLAKDAVQNILTFRFANTFLKSTWNHQYIKEVRITMFESHNVQNRGAFYDAIGTLRDVGQNHLLQMLALIAMDEPDSFSAADIRKSRSAVLDHLVPVTADSVHKQVVRAQYDGYCATPGVIQNSSTETYFEFRAFIDMPAWKDVPFTIRAGKALKNDEVHVEVLYKPVDSDLFNASSNSVILTISPVQSMNITLNTKSQEHTYGLEEQTLSFAWAAEEQKGITAYQKVLLDCINADHTLFTKTEEVLASWKYINSIMEHWGSVPLQTYQQGSAGPEYTLTFQKSVV